MTRSPRNRYIVLKFSFRNFDRNMAKTAKARKSTHAKSKTAKATREKIMKDDPTKEYELESVGPLYILWGKKKIRNDKGKTVKKYYAKKDEKHLIWVKWTQGYSDKPNVQWSAEPQGTKLYF
jgi:hypothetical protein